MNPLPSRRPRLALPYSVLPERDTVRLVAGEDFRYTLTGPGLDQWLPGLLARLDGRRTVADLVAGLPDNHRDAALQLIERLYGERVLVEGTAADAHRPDSCRLVIEGRGDWADDLRTLSPGQGVVSVAVLVQDRLDYDEALRFNRRCRQGASPWLWVSTGAMGRAYLSPLFLPDAGPCLACLLGTFRGLSPAPELYDALTEHARRGGSLVPVPFPEKALAVLRDLLFWKASLLEEAVTPAALYRLHVLEVDTLEVSSHPVRIDPECPVCGGGGP